MRLLCLVLYSMMSRIWINFLLKLEISYHEPIVKILCIIRHIHSRLWFLYTLGLWAIMRCPNSFRYLAPIIFSHPYYLWWVIERHLCYELHLLYFILLWRPSFEVILLYSQPIWRLMLEIFLQEFVTFAEIDVLKVDVWIIIGVEYS